STGAGPLDGLPGRAGPPGRAATLAGRSAWATTRGAEGPHHLPIAPPELALGVPHALLDLLDLRDLVGAQVDLVRDLLPGQGEQALALEADLIEPGPLLGLEDLG